MKKIFASIFCMVLVFTLVVAGCSGKKAESSKAAISEAKTMQTTEEKVNYLVSQAKSFYNSKKFQDSIDIAQYVLRTLDKDSQAAKDLLQKAKDALKAQVQKVMEDAKGGLAGFGK